MTTETLTDDRYAIGFRVFAERWFVMDRTTGEVVGRTYATREEAISAMERLNSRGAAA